MSCWKGRREGRERASKKTRRGGRKEGSKISREGKKEGRVKRRDGEKEGGREGRHSFPADETALPLLLLYFLEDVPGC